MTFGKREFEALDIIMRATIKPLHTAMQQMLLMVDKDAEAFSDYMVITISMESLWFKPARSLLHYQGFI